MKKSLQYVLATVALVSCMISCSDNKYPSLQKYYVDNAENSNFINIDIPISLLGLSAGNFDADQKLAYESIKKMNVLAFQLKENNKEDYDLEKSTVNSILKNPKYQELMKLNNGTTKTTIRFVGNDDAIDEMILFGTDKNLGFALIRVLGNDMEPEKIMKLMESIDPSGAGLSQGLGQLGSLFGQ